MRTLKLHNLFGIVIVTLCLSAIPLQSQAASKNKHQTDESTKERLVLMPLRIPYEDKNLTGAMETALVKGLQRKYDVYSGEQVSQKAHEIFMKENRNTAHKECDETKCMQNIAIAFQAELIATANITKQEGIYYLALSIQNIFDNKVVYSESLPCKKCDGAQVVDKLKELSGTVAPVAPTSPAQGTDHQSPIVQQFQMPNEAELKASYCSAVAKEGLAAYVKQSAQFDAAISSQVEREKMDRYPPYKESIEKGRVMIKELLSKSEAELDRINTFLLSRPNLKPSAMLVAYSRGEADFANIQKNKKVDECSARYRAPTSTETKSEEYTRSSSLQACMEEDESWGRLSQCRDFSYLP